MWQLCGSFKVRFVPPKDKEVSHYITVKTFKRHILACVSFLREQPHQEVAFFVGIEGGSYDTVDAWLETETVGDLPSVDERVGAGTGGVVQEVVLDETSSARVFVLKLEKIKNVGKLMDI